MNRVLCCTLEGAWARATSWRTHPAIPGERGMPVSCPNMTPGCKPQGLKRTQVCGCSQSLWWCGAGGDLGSTPGTGNVRSDGYTSRTAVQRADTTHRSSQSDMAHLETCCVGKREEIWRPKPLLEALMQISLCILQAMYIALDTPHTPQSGGRKGRTENEGKSKKNLPTEKGGNTHAVSANRQVFYERQTLLVWVDEQAGRRQKLDTNHSTSSKENHISVFSDATICWA